MTKFCGHLVVLVFSVMLIAGCGLELPSAAPINKESEPNDTFTEAKVITENSENPFKIEGTLSSDSDHDVFNIGNFRIGETIKIEVRTSQRFAIPKITIGLFDKDEEIARLEDLISPTTSFRTVFVHTVRKSGDYFLGISAGESFLDAPFDYIIRVTLGADNPPVPSGQIVYINFHGGDDIWIGGDFYSHLLPLSSINSTLNAEELSQRIIDLMRLDYFQFNLDIISSYEQQEPHGDHSTVYITGSDDNYFGLAESTDWYNADQDDIAIVFGGALYDKNMSFDQLAQMIANVASHELGHLLGLVHTEDDTELMDAVTPSNLLDEDQDFHRAELTDFPIGYQDAMELLELTLGLI